jgi:hypothetical protein
MVQKLPIFFGGFMTGEMENPLVLGKATKLPCFKNIDMKKLPIDWKSKKETG